ncbi:AraC family transcriptional regulator [Leptospira langatensis]|uniref:AraC family transcriptional regulator n=1 Tax=Leptospira langatensis TaxID=2484983 RepID=A0A5F1ZRT5_9LEPT|nr:AraC family transcriptional regulator [Leptospira langatensis]TGL38796.1 AraC family transcriptional regulator [Leptospira langatensis]
MDIYSVYLIFGALFAGIWAAGILLSSASLGERIRFSFILIASSLWLLSGAAFISGWIFRLPFAFGIHLPFVFGIAPVLVLHFQITLLKENVSLLEILPHFIPSIFCFLLLIPYWTSGEEFQIRILESFGRSGEPYPLILAFLQIGPKISLLVYLIPLLFTYKMYFYKRKQDEGEENARRLFLLFLGLVSILIFAGLLGFLLRSTELIRGSMYGLPLLIVFAFLVSQREPTSLGIIGKSLREVRYKRSRLVGTDERTLRDRLEALMREEKIYADEDLTLGQLARELELTNHQLSEFLNNRLSMKFSDYINSWRIKEAKTLLLEETERSILSISESVGFNSKSAFNEAFKKFTDHTPSDYRKNAKRT